MTSLKSLLTKQSNWTTALKVGLSVTLMAGTFTLSGCKKKAPPPRKPKPKITKAPDPEWQLVSSGMGLTPKLDYQDALYHECSDAQMRASFQFLDALARGDDAALRPMLSSDMKPVLDNLVETDEWQESTDSIRNVILTGCNGASGGKVEITFAIQTDGEQALDVQTWYGQERGSDFLFSAGYELAKELSADANLFISAERVAMGRAAFEKGRCSRCHGDDAKGGNRAPNLTDKNYLHGNSIRSILSVLENGIAEDDIVDENFSRPMDPATELIDDDDELRALAEFIWALSHPDQAEGLDDVGGDSDEDDGDDNERNRPVTPKGKDRPGSPGGPG